MRFSDNPERQRILKQALTAKTLSAIQTAAQELRQWVQDNPIDMGIVDAFEVLSHRQDFAEQQTTERDSATQELISAMKG